MTDDLHDDLEDRIAAAQAMNRLAHALVRHRAEPDVLQRIAGAADSLAADIEQQPVRERRMELVTAPRFERALEEGPASLRSDGAFVDMFEDSPVSGSANPLSVGLKVGTDGDEAIGRVTLSPGWQGAPDRAHGGIVAAIVDETFGALLPLLGVVAFTGELTCRYVAPTPMGVQLEFRARKVGAEGRKLFFECDGTARTQRFMQARATFITIDLGRFRKT